MKLKHEDKLFVRYADDIVVHSKSERQAEYMLKQIQKRLSDCKLKVHVKKTKIVNVKGKSDKKYPRGFDFLGFTIRYQTRMGKSKDRFMSPSQSSNKHQLSKQCTG